MAHVDIIAETAQPNGWLFDAQVIDESGLQSHHEVTLSWVDYNHWSGSGGDEPSAVASAVLRYLFARVGAGELKPRFDAAIARRLFDDADTAIPGLIGG